MCICCSDHHFKAETFDLQWLKRHSPLWPCQIEQWPRLKIIDLIKLDEWPHCGVTGMMVSKLNHPQAIIQPELDDIWMAMFMFENAICNGWDAANWAHFPMVPLATQDKNGCLVIQEALESATWEMQMPIMTELKGKVCLGCPSRSFWPRKFIEEVWKNDG